MNVYIQEQPPVIEKTGWSFGHVLGFSFVVALLAVLIGFGAGIRLGENEKEEAIGKLKEQHGIIDRPVPPLPSDPTR